MQGDLCESCAKVAEDKARNTQEVVNAWLVFLILFFHSLCSRICVAYLAFRLVADERLHMLTRYWRMAREMVTWETLHKLAEGRDWDRMRPFSLESSLAFRIAPYGNRVPCKGAETAPGMQQ